MNQAQTQTMQSPSKACPLVLPGSTTDHSSKPPRVCTSHCLQGEGVHGAGARLLVPVSGAGEEEVSQDHAWGQAVHAHRLPGSCRLLVQATHEMSNACTQTAL